jgi:murein DD-endopeptidase MepM/ murein hydrolase activator NlpD
MRRSIRALWLAVAAALILPAAAIASWPIASRYSYVSQWFHYSHKAMDLAAPSGTRIVPIATGKVVFAGWKNNCGGYQVWVSHGNGLYTAYYHMSRETSWKGRTVTKGLSTLGYVGATGCAWG